jgi:uncharacterized coiled-coil DUF342 family protein
MRENGWKTQLSGKQKTQTIQQLEQKLTSLLEEEDSLRNLTNQLAEKRNKLNDRSRNLREEVQQLRTERDQVNNKVKTLKEKRNDLTSTIKEKIERIKQVNEEGKSIAEKKPRRTHKDLQDEVDSIDWKIQTTSHTLQEDKEMVEQVKQLEAQLSVHKKLEHLRKTVQDEKAHVARLRAESQQSHQGLTAQAQIGQELHSRMLAKIGEAKTVKAEADAFHKQFLEAKEKAKPVREQIVSITTEIRRLKGEVREEEQEERKHNEDELRESLETKAREKLKRGEKLSWQEFQLLSEKGVITQD